MGEASGRVVYYRSKRQYSTVQYSGLHLSVTSNRRLCFLFGLFLSPPYSTPSVCLRRSRHGLAVTLYIEIYNRPSRPRVRGWSHVRPAILRYHPTSTQTSNRTLSHIIPPSSSSSSSSSSRRLSTLALDLHDMAPTVLIAFNAALHVHFRRAFCPPRKNLRRR